MKNNSPEFKELRKSIAKYIDNYPPATQEDNKKKLERLHQLKKTKDSCKKDKQEYYNLRDELTISNGGFAMKYAVKYSKGLNNDTSLNELFHEATIGIIETIDAFDPDKDTAFTTYAFYHVRKRLIDYIKKNKLVKAPRDIARNIKHVNEMQERLFTQLGQEPSAFDIKMALKKEKNIDLKENLIDRILILLDHNSAGSDDAFVSETVDQLSEEDYESDLFRSIELNILTSLQQYDEKQQRIIKLRFGIGEDYPHTVEEIKLMMDVKDEELKKI